MNNMLQSVLKSINSKDNIVVGVSGGADSMVLLSLLLQARQSTAFNMQVLHVEHGIRGEESLRDANFVKDFCKANNIDCKIVNADIPSLAKKTKQTIEQCARNVRLQAFEQYTAKGYKLFLAHNKDDQAETILMHIFRGSGIDGARGIVSMPNVYRPLIQYTKAEILSYAKTNKIAFVEDSTNSCNEYSRNFVRNTLLPQISQKYPNIVDNLVRFADFCTLAEDLVQYSIDKSWIVKNKNYVSVKTEAFNKNQLIVAKVIKQAYNMCGEFADLESKHIVMLTEFVKTCKNGAVCNLPHNISAELRDAEVLFYKNSNKNTDMCSFCLGDNILPNNRQVKICKNDDNIQFKSGIFYADYHKIPANAVWRTRQVGDVFQKLGSRGKKKLNDYFTDKKLSLIERNNTMLLASGNTILLVLGYDISENIKIDSDTTDIIKIDFSKN